MKSRKTLLILSFLIASLGMSSCGKQESPFVTQTKEVYQMAQDAGFEGTYEEWLDSIKGETGKPGKEITSIIFGGVENNVATYNIIFNDGSTTKITIPLVKGDKGDQGETGPQGPAGEKGEDGKPGQNGQDGAPGKDGVDGEDGRSIVSIKLKSSEVNIDTYEIKYSDGTTSTFTITNGQDGPQGIQGVPGNDGHTPVIEINSKGHWVIDGVDTGKTAYGPQGPIGPMGPEGPKGEPGKDGVDGEDGRSIVSIKLKTSDGYVDTYEILYSDNTSSYFLVKNGEKGETGAQGIQGIQGIPGKDGTSPEVSINEKGHWVINGVDTGKVATGPQGPIGPQGEKGEPGKDGLDGKSAYEIYLEHHPEYTKSEAEWIEDVINGTLVAKKYHTVTFDTGFDLSIPSQSIEHGEKVKKPDPIQRDFYTFEGWYYQNEIWSFPGYVVTEDMVISAKWTKLSTGAYIVNKFDLKEPWIKTLDETPRTLNLSCTVDGNSYYDVNKMLTSGVLKIESTDTNVISVDGLTLTPHNPGKATINVITEGVADSVTLEVLEAPMTINNALQEYSDELIGPGAISSESRTNFAVSGLVVAWKDSYTAIIYDGERFAQVYDHNSMLGSLEIGKQYLFKSVYLEFYNTQLELCDPRSFEEQSVTITAPNKVMYEKANIDAFIEKVQKPVSTVSDIVDPVGVRINDAVVKSHETYGRCPYLLLDYQGITIRANLPSRLGDVTTFSQYDIVNLAGYAIYYDTALYEFGVYLDQVPVKTGVYSNDTSSDGLSIPITKFIYDKAYYNVFSVGTRTTITFNKDSSQDWLPVTFYCKASSEEVLATFNVLKGTISSDVNTSIIIKMYDKHEITYEPFNANSPAELNETLTFVDSTKPCLIFINFNTFTSKKNSGTITLDNLRLEKSI